LAILQSFYDFTDTTLSGKLLTPSGGLQQVQPPNLPFFGKHVSGWLPKKLSEELKKQR
jgi:hypothetical protein